MFLTYVPRFPLSPFIVKFWYAEFAPRHAFERVLPNGDMALISNLRDVELQIYDQLDAGPQRFAGPTIMGAHSRDFVIDTRLQASLIGVQFRPGGAYRFLGDSADQVQNRHVALEDLWSHAADELQGRLMGEITTLARFQRLEQALIGRLADSVQPHPAVASALSTFVARRGVASIQANAKDSGVSWRRFIELFRQEVGVTPKTFCRIRRFQDALQQLAAEPCPSFAELALHCGYYDQAHLIRDFRDFTHSTPTLYRAMRGKLLNYVPIVDEVKNIQYAARADVVR